MSDKDELGQTLPRSNPAALPSANAGTREALPQHDDARYAVAEGEVDPELGRGGMGRVLKLVDTNLRREVAVKELLREHTAEHSSSGPLLEALFVREARVLALLEHPGVVPVYELGRRGDGTPYYVMRRIHGRSLSSVLENAVSLDERLAMLAHLIDVVNTVGYAHSRRVVHRDLKPENVMVGPFGETQVIDWGLATVNGEMTPGSELAGTPAYMAPEQANGVGVDARSDVWALGVMLFELLTGKRPFDAGSPTQVLDNVRTAPIPAVKSIEPRAPKALVEIVERALQRAPSLRFQNAGEMAEALEAAQRARAPKPTGLVLAVIALALTCAALLFVAGDARQRVNAAQGAARRSVADAQREHAQAQAEAALTAWRARDAVKALRLAKTVPDNPLAAGVELLVSERGAPEQRWSVTVPAGCSSLVAIGTDVACATLNGIALFGADGRQRGEFSTGPVGWQHAMLMVGEQLVSGGDDRLLRFWNVETRQEAHTVNGFAAGIRALATDGADVIVGLADGSVLRVAADGTVSEVTKHARPILWLAATPGQVTSVSDSLLRVTGPSPMELDRHVGAVAALNARELSIGVERSVVLVRDGDVKLVSSGHRDDVTALAHVDGRVLSGSADGTLRWWFEDGSAEGVLEGFAPGISALAVNDTQVFIATSNRKLEAWSLPARAAVSSETAVPSAYQWWAGAGLVTGYRDGRLVRTDEKTGEAHTLEARHFGPVRGIARVTGDDTSDAVRFISGGDDGRVLAQRWNGSVDVLDAIEGARVLSVAATSTGTHVAWSADDGTRVVWSLEFGKEVSRSRDTRVRVLSFSKDGRWLAMGRDDKHVTVIETATGKEVHTLGPADGAISALAWSPDGTRVITGSTDGHLTEWNVDDQRAVRTLTQPGGRIGVLELAGDTLVAGSDDGSTWLFRRSDGALLAQIPADSGNVLFVAFTSTGLLTAGTDRLVHSFPYGDGRR